MTETTDPLLQKALSKLATHGEHFKRYIKRDGSRYYRRKVQGSKDGRSAYRYTASDIFAVYVATFNVQ